MAAARKKKNEKPFAQTRANNATMNEEEVAFAQTQATNDGKDGGFPQQRDETETATQEAPNTLPMVARAAAAT